MMFDRGFQGGYRGGGCFAGGYLGGWHMLIMAVILLAVIFTVIYLVNKSTHRNDNKDVLDILKMKYVQGELTEEEYTKRKELLLKK
jgi:putative membrane protein